MRKLLFLVAGLFLCTRLLAQWSPVYHGTDSTNNISGIHFLNATQGFIASTHYIGYTTDGGRTFSKRFITLSNVDYSGYGVNLTFGFEPSDIHALDANRLIVSGDYGLEPAILYSANGGASWKLVYHRNIREGASTIYNKVHGLRFFGNTGFALQNDEFVKTTDGGLTWSIIINAPNSEFSDFSFPDASNGYVISRNRMYRTNNGGQWFTEVTNAPGDKRLVSFVNATTGFLHTSGHEKGVWKTTNSGGSWQRTGEDAFVPYDVEDLHFTSATTGFIAGLGYRIYKTTDAGRSWEQAAGSDEFTYLNYGYNRLFFLDANTAWAGAYHDLLSKTTTGGAPTIPKAAFRVNKSTLCANGIVALENYSSPDRSFQWFLNGQPLATTYNATYSADDKRFDTIMLVVSGSGRADTSVQYTEAQAFGTFSFVSVPVSDTACSNDRYYVDIPNSDPNATYAIRRGNIGNVGVRGNGGTLRIADIYSGVSTSLEITVDAVRVTDCGTERKSNTHRIHFFTPFIDVQAKADTVCSNITQYVEVLNSIEGYEYWTDTTYPRVQGTGGRILLPFRIPIRNFGYHYSNWDPYPRYTLRIFARHARYGCFNIFPRTEVTMTVRDPWARMKPIGYEVKTGQPLSFRNSTLDADFYHWRIDSAEGDTSSTAFEPTDLFIANPGRYRLHLFATSRQGCVDTASTTIEVYDAAAFTGGTIPYCTSDSSASDHYYRVRDTHKDAGGNLYLTGAKMKISNYFTGKGLEGWFLQKRSPSGSIVWEVSNTIAVGLGHMITESVTADKYENVYLYGHLYRDPGSPGYFVDTVQFGPRASAAFVAKINARGKLVWIRTASNHTKDERYYPQEYARSFAGGSLVASPNGELYLKIASDYVNYNFGDTLIKGGKGDAFIFHFNEDGRLLDHHRFTSREAVRDVHELNGDMYHHSPKMQWDAAGNLRFTALTDSSASMFTYSPSAKRITQVLPLFSERNGNRIAALPLAFTTGPDGSFYTASYNRVEDTLRPGPASLVFPPDLAETRDPDYKLKTYVSAFDASGNLRWQKLVDGLKPVSMFLSGGRLHVAGENFAPDFHRWAGSSYNSNIGVPYYHAGTDTLFIGFPHPDRKKITCATDSRTGETVCTEGAGGIDHLLLSLNPAGSGLQLRTWGGKGDDLLHLVDADSCGNLIAVGYAGRQPKSEYSTTLYPASSAALTVWQLSPDGTCIQAPCTDAAPALRWEPISRNDRCVDTAARLYWAAARTPRVDIHYSVEGGPFQPLVTGYAGDSLYLRYNPKTFGLRGRVLFRIAASGNPALQDTLSTLLATPPAGRLNGRDTLMCYYDTMTLRAPEGPYRYQWQGGSWNTGPSTHVPPNAAGQTGVFITDTLTGCRSFDYMNIRRTPYFPKARILVDSSSALRIVSTECGIRHQWRLNGRLLPDTGCVIIPRDTGTYSVATVVNGCVSDIYSGAGGYYRVSGIPRTVRLSRSPAMPFCTGDSLRIDWNASGTASLRLRYRSNGTGAYTTFTTLTTGAEPSGRFVLPLADFRGVTQFLLETADTGIYAMDTATWTVSTAPRFSLGPDQVLCPGTSATLGVTAQSGYTYQWSTGALTPTISAAPRDSARYSLTVRDALGCAFTDTVSVRTRRIDQPYIIADTLLRYLETTHCGTTHQWYIDGELQATNGCRIEVARSGVYTVRLSENGCTGEPSDTLRVVVPGAAGSLVLAPNPATDRLIVSAILAREAAEVTIEIFGENGYRYFYRRYGTQPAGTFRRELTGADLPASGGIFFVRVQAGNEVFVNRVIIMK